MPSPETVGSVMTDLLGKEVTVRQGTPLALRPNAEVCFSFFRDDENNPVAVFICDLALAAYTGASLAMVPAEEGKSAIRAKELPESLFENFREVVNIVGGTLFNAPEAPHLVLREVFVSPSTLPAEMKSLLVQPYNGIFVDVQIEDYGEGKLTLLCAYHEAEVDESEIKAEVSA